MLTLPSVCCYVEYHMLSQEVLYGTVDTLLKNNNLLFWFVMRKPSQIPIMNLSSIIHCQKTTVGWLGALPPLKTTIGCLRGPFQQG